MTDDRRARASTVACSLDRQVKLKNGHSIRCLESG